MHAFSKIPSARHLIFKYRASKTQKFFFIFSRAAYKFLNFCRTLSTVNISEMADKEKRFRKVILNAGFKGKLKLVDTLDEAHLVLVHDKQCASRTKLIGKDSWLIFTERGYTFPEEDVYYVIFSPTLKTRDI